MPLLLGLDIGTTICKAVIFDEAGRPLASGSSTGYPIYRQADGSAEQAPADWWRAAIEAVGTATKAIGDRASEVAAIGMCGAWGQVFAKPNGEVVERSITWQDARAHDEARWLAETVGTEAMRKMVTVALPLTATLPPARLLWLRRHRPEFLSGAWLMVQPKDYVTYRLTGSWATDPASCVTVLDLHARRIDPGFAKLFDLPPNLLPELRDPFEPAGHLLPDIARSLGLPAGIPVATGWVDSWASMFGTGLGVRGLGFDVAGTSETVGLTADHVTGDHHGLLVMPLGDSRHTVYGLTVAGGDSLKWFVEAFVDEVASDAAFATFEREAAITMPGADGLLFLPYLFGERTPLWDERVRGQFFGIDRGHRRRHFSRAVIEGLAHCVRQIVTLGETVAGAKIDTIRASGGAARSAAVNQIKADVLQKPVEITAVTEAGTLGAAMLAAIALGLADGYADAVQRMVHVARRFEPDPALADRYDADHKRYCALYPAIKGI
ncbi:MAG TPA: FGGY family carbohydrate kinase [Magnetospirillaceae bacterium]|jgi:xylulokinase